MLRTILFTLVVTIISNSPQAQQPTATTPPLPFEILGFSWSRQQQTGALETGMPGAGNTPAQSTRNIDQQLEVLLQQAPNNKQAIEDLEQRKRQEQQPGLVKAKRTEEKATYKYNLEIKNISDKQVSEIVWNYTFLDSKTSQEVIRHSFTSKIKIKANKKANITVHSSLSPYQVISAKDSNDKKTEQISIQQILYSDGTIWKR